MNHPTTLQKQESLWGEGENHATSYGYETTYMKGRRATDYGTQPSSRGIIGGQKHEQKRAQVYTSHCPFRSL